MKRFWLVLPFVIAFGTTAFAQTDEIARRFQKLDTNQDGKLSDTELKAEPDVRKRLMGADTDGDGLLTEAEIRQHLKRPIRPAPKAPAEEPKSSPVREAPRFLPAAAAGVGRMIPDFPITTIDGRSTTLQASMGKRGLVIAYTNTTCPICKKYGPTLTKLEASLAEQEMALLLINPTMTDDAEDIAAFRKTHQLRAPYVHDRTGQLSKTLAATSTAEVFLLDAQRTLVYRGAIDDQYGLGYSKDAPSYQYLADAIQSLRAGKAIDPAATTAPGCALDLDDVKPLSVATTYHNRISRIVQMHCVECHREGGVAPFRLDRPEDLIAHAGMIRKVVDRGTMPPWFAKSAAMAHSSAWVNDRTLPTTDKQDLLSWLQSDRPLGDPKDAPAPRTFADGWLIGKPDAIYAFPKPVRVKANGTMPYQLVTVDTQLKEDRWVNAIEVRPGARDVVHHVLVFVLPPGKNADDADDDTAEQEQRGGFFAAYVPGQSVLRYPAGLAKKLPKGARLRFQMHYTPNGTETMDTTRIGVSFTDREPDYEVNVAGLSNPRLRIPAGADHHPVEAKLTVPGEVTLLGFMPHMHLRGKAFRYEITTKSGTTETILDIPHYDFNWQLYYRFAEPRTITAGTTVKATGWYDNSANNPANPDPNKEVRWGPQTTDEMMLGYVEFIVPVGSSASRAMGNLDAIFRRVDSNADGKISRAEYDAYVPEVPQLKDRPVVARMLFTRLDANRDDNITPEEFRKLNLPR